MGTIRQKITLPQIIIMVFLFLLTLTMIVPMLNILAKSLSSSRTSVLMGGLEIWPRQFDTINYRIVFQHPILIAAFSNSVIITVVGTIINMFLTTTAAYVLTRPKLTLKKPIMVFLIFMMLLDPGLVPEYLVVQKLGLMGSKWSVILVTAINVYYLIIMMRYFGQVPESIVEAGIIDGAGHGQMLWSVFIPLTRSGIATITMFYAVIRWNEFFKASIYLTRKSTDTVLQVILRQFVILGDTVSIVGSQNLWNYNEFAQADYNAIKGATIIVAIVPILILYPFVLKYYTKDVMGGGVKE